MMCFIFSFSFVVRGARLLCLIKPFINDLVV
ncbi:hypothetical protein GLYMA_12G084551v4 [Glycine max]|nr:hypothetical protein GLYMA_12G084551v4 [Glycine max]KAH1142259.1 hypothetical protein GYH30_033096 [Glycine max]